MRRNDALKINRIPCSEQEEGGVSPKKSKSIICSQSCTLPFIQQNLVFSFHRPHKEGQVNSTNGFRLTAILMVVGLLLFSLGMAPRGVYSTLAAPSDGTVTIPPGDPIEIAAAMFYGFATFQDFFDAVQMAIDDYGPINGFDFQRNDYDAGCSEGEGDTAGAAIVANPQNVGVIGPFCSISTRGAAPHFETALVPMISHSNTMPDLYPYGPTVFNRMVVIDPGYEFWEQTVSALASVAAWQADFETVYGRTPDEFAKFAYDATTLLLTRIDQVSTTDGGGNLVIDRSELVFAVRDTFNFPAVTGPVSFDFHGDRVNTYFNRVWTDDFSGTTLEDRWSFIDEDSTHWSLTARPGFLRITTQGGMRNRLLQAIPEGEYSIRTRLLFEPTENFQFAGLVVYGDADNYLQFGRAYCDIPPPFCVGNGIYFDHIEGGELVGSSFPVNTTSLDEAYLLLMRQGDDYTAYVSENGAAWTMVGTHTIGFAPTGFGVEAGNQTIEPAEIPADFDNFILQGAARLIYLPISIK